MPELLPNALLLLVWEAALALAAGRIAYWAVGSDGEDRDDDATWFLTWLACNVTLACLAGSAWSFLGWNGVTVYLVTAAALAAFSATYALRVVRRLTDLALDATKNLTPLGWLGVAIAATLALVGMRPATDIDSVLAIDYVYVWMRNEGTPYQMAWRYVAYWEAGYVPGMTLSSSDAFMWLHSLKAVALAGIALYVLGRRIGTEPRLAAWTSMATLCLYQFWTYSSGVPTLKNDAILNAGLLLAAIAGVRMLKGSATRLDAVWLAMAASFAGVKYVGPLAGVAFVVCFAITRIRFRGLAGWFSWKEALATCAILAFAFLTVGHYYVRNIVVYDNVFTPIEMKIAGFELPGHMKVEGTSILNNADDPDLYRALFLPSADRHAWLPAAGVLFALVLVGALTLMPTLLAARFFCRGRTFGIDGARFFCGLFALAMWALFFRSFWSAGSEPGDLRYVEHLASIRYATAAVGMTEMLFVALLAGFAPRVAGVFVGIQLATRVAYLASALHPELLGWSPIATAAVVVVGTIALLRLLAKSGPTIRRLAPGYLIAVAAALTIAGGYWSDARRDAWLVAYRPVWKRLLDEPGLTIACRGPFSTNYPLYGRRFQHRLVRFRKANVGPMGALDGVDVVAAIRAWGYPPDASDFDELSGKLARRGFRVVVHDGHVLLAVAANSPAAKLFEDAPPDSYGQTEDGEGER